MSTGFFLDGPPCPATSDSLSRRPRPSRWLSARTRVTSSPPRPARHSRHLHSEIIGQALADPTRGGGEWHQSAEQRSVRKPLGRREKLHDLVVGQVPIAAVSSFGEPGIARHYVLLSDTERFSSRNRDDERLTTGIPVPTGRPTLEGTCPSSTRPSRRERVGRRC